MILLCLLLFVAAPAQAAFQSVLGIPDPPFGINEVAPPRPANWHSDVPGFYYVDEALGTDVTGKLGDPDHPRKTIPATICQGCVVEVHGTYSRRQAGSGTDIKFAGTASQPAWIRGMDAFTKPTITNYWKVYGTYGIMENLNFPYFNNVNPGGTLPSKVQLIFQVPAAGQLIDHIVMRESEMSGFPGGGGSAMKSFSGARPSYMVYYHNHIHHNGGADTAGTPDEDLHGLQIDGGSNNIWVLESELDHNSGDGVQLTGGGNQTSIDHVYLGRNHGHHNKQYCLWVKHASDVVISENTCHDFLQSSSTTGGCLGSQYTPTRIWWLFNHCYTAQIGIRWSTDQERPQDGWEHGEHYVIGNWFHNIRRTWNPAVSPPTNANAGNYSEYNYVFNIKGDGSVDRHFVNNTMYNVDGCLTWMFSRSSGAISAGQPEAVFYARNNICGKRDSSRAVHLVVYPTQIATLAQMSGWLFFDPSAAIYWGGGGTGTIRTLASLNGAPVNGWNCPGCVEGSPAADPKFVLVNDQLIPQQGPDVKNLNLGAMQTTYVTPTIDPMPNLRIQAGSAALDSGQAAPEYATFQSLYGINIAYDLDRRTRPQGGALDIGAYEYQAGGTHTCN